MKKICEKNTVGSRRRLTKNAAFIAMAVAIFLGTAANAFAAGSTGAADVTGSTGSAGYTLAPGVVNDGAIVADKTPVIETDGISDIVGIGAEIGAEIDSEALDMIPNDTVFSKKKGVVTQIENVDLNTFIRVEESEKGETDFMILDGETVISDLDGLIDLSAVQVGMEVEAYYIQPLVMTLQYPARFNAAVIIVRNEGNPGAAFVGMVDKDWMASDGSIKFNPSDAIMFTRDSYDNAVTGSVYYYKYPIIAYYAVATNSIPPQAPLSKIVILEKMSVPIILNGQRLFNAGARVRNEDGTVMIPLRAVIEGVGQSVEWDEAQQTVRVGVAIIVKIGSDEYTIGRAMPQKLEAAAELFNGRTYVPLSFFGSILGMTVDESSGPIKIDE